MRNQKMFQMRLVALALSGLLGGLIVTPAHAIETCDPVKNEKAEQGYVCLVDTAGGVVIWSLEIKSPAGKKVWKDYKSGLLVSDQYEAYVNQYEAEDLCHPAWLPTDQDPRGGLLPIQWRLPTGYPEEMNGQHDFPNEDSDWVTLEKDGIRSVVPRMGFWFWSSSVIPNDTDYAYDFNGFDGYIYYGNRNVDSDSVRCVGR